MMVLLWGFALFYGLAKLDIHLLPAHPFTWWLPDSHDAISSAMRDLEQYVLAVDCDVLAWILIPMLACLVALQILPPPSWVHIIARIRSNRDLTLLYADSRTRAF